MIVKRIQLERLTSDVGVSRDMVIVNWTIWTIFNNVLHIFDQIFLGSWCIEQIGQKSDAIDANFLSMFAQVVYISNTNTTDAQHHCKTMFAANFQPFLCQAFMLINTEGCSFANGAIDQNTTDSLRLQVLAILFNHIPIDRSPVKLNNKNSYN